MNKRLIQLLESGEVPCEGGIFLDCYNQTVSEIAGTITTRIDASSNYFITDVYEGHSDREFDRRKQLHQSDARARLFNRGNCTNDNNYGGGTYSLKL